MENKEQDCNTPGLNAPGMEYYHVKRNELVWKKNSFLGVEKML